MSLPMRVDSFVEGNVYYPLQLVLKEGKLSYINDDGITVTDIAGGSSVEAATSISSGIVTLSDAVDSTSDADSSVAATPAAVKKAYEQIRVLDAAPENPSVGEIWIIDSSATES